MSLVVWYFGTSRRFEDVYHHTMVLGPRYEGLLTDIFKRKVLTQDFSLYLHRPTANDPSLAPPGCDAFYVLAPVPNLAGGTDWRAEAEPYRQRIQQRLEETVMPGLGGCIVTSRMLTPQDFRDRLLSVNGAAFSLEPQLFQSAWFRPHNVSEEVEGLFLVGAGTHPGAGGAGRGFVCASPGPGGAGPGDASDGRLNKQDCACGRVRNPGWPSATPYQRRAVNEASPPWRKRVSSLFRRC